VPQDRAQRPDPSASPQGPGAQGSVPRVPVANSSGPALPPSNSVSTKGTYFLGRYRVVDEIGIGGMASVHLARMDGPGGFQKWVAIKRIHPHLIEDDSFIHMFLDEARIAARISHPNVATVFELGKHDDTYWIAMEYLHGEPLREVMRRTEETGAPMPPEIACRVIADAAEGLHAAHELLGKNGEKLNLIHRDVTPHNLFVTYEGTTKVVDFGIAKFSSRMSSTRAGTLKGKLAYMSPEQVQGETIDRRTDIFALGVVLWELTTGQRLFRMDSDLDTLAKVQECNIPRPSTLVRGYPIDLEKIVMKALSKNRGERFKTAREFSRQLQSLLMRRGLFIASDEVANYVQGIFKDRIEKREAHLRWAGEVTQTINVEALQAAGHVLPPEGSPLADASFRSDHSDVQAAGAPARPRPAAGMPASAPQPASPVSRQSARLAAPPLSGPPSPAAPKRDLPDYELDDADDAPTLQATVAQVRAAREPVSAPTGASAYTGGSGFDADFEDVSDTIVERNLDDDPPTSRPAQAPLPAAGRPPAARDSEHPTIARPIERPDFHGGGPRTLPLNTASPTGPRGPYAPSALQAGPQTVRGTGAFPPPPLNISDPSLPPTLAVSPGPSLGAPLPMPPRPLAESAHDPAAPPSGLVVSGGRMMAPTVPRLFVPPTGDGTQTTGQSARNNRAPWWAVAILAATAVVVVGGFVFFLLSLFSSPSAPVASSNAGPSAAQGPKTTPAPTTPAPSAAAVAPSPAPAAPAGSTPGPFMSARNAFLTAIVPQPTSAAAPAPSSTANTADTAAAAAPTAPAASVAAADNAPAAPVAQPQAAPDPVPAPPQAAPTPLAAAPQPQPAQVAASSHHPANGGAAGTGGARGLLTVVCLPACDQIYDNGQLLGPSPVFKRAAPVGSHKIKLVLNSNPSATKTISTVVVADQVSVVRESMP
jgi:eukaryotic-like serine/threonine-protein kinase